MQLRQNVMEVMEVIKFNADNGAMMSMDGVIGVVNITHPAFMCLKIITTKRNHISYLNKPYY
jgi:hypothetical protein